MVQLGYGQSSGTDMQSGVLTAESAIRPTCLPPLALLVDDIEYLAFCKGDLVRVIC